MVIHGLFSGESLNAQIPHLSREEAKHFRKISNEAFNAPVDLSASPYHLARYLTRHTKNDMEKVRAFYVWIANNITYDMKSFQAGLYPDFHPRAVLKEKKAVCEGYARLMQALCIEADIKCEIIRGYSKGYGYRTGQSFSTSNHSWNAVEIDGEWQLVDATWAATRTNTSKVKLPLSNHYFFTHPQTFLLDHLPEVPMWQMVSNPISLEDFESGDRAIQLKLSGKGDYHYRDSLKVFMSMNASDRILDYQKRASVFNPKNTGANYHRGVEYLYRGLDSLELLDQVQDADIDTAIPYLEKRVFSMLQEAAFHFSGIRPSSPYYESAQNFLDETIYDRGVFKYEAAIRLIDIYREFDPSKKKTSFKRYESLVNRYFEEAKIYFQQVPFDSWFHDQAKSYINYYLDKKFAEL